MQTTMSDAIGLRDVLNKELKNKLAKGFTMVSLDDILTITLIVLIIFLIVAVSSLISLIKNIKDVVNKNKKPLENILSDVSKLTNETVTLEDKIKGYIVDLIGQFLTKKDKE